MFAHMNADAICRKWVERIGGGFHPDTRGASYVETGSDGKPYLTAAQIAEYDADMETLFSAGGDPYEHAVRAMEEAGAI